MDVTPSLLCLQEKKIKNNAENNIICLFIVIDFKAKINEKDV